MVVSALLVATGAVYAVLALSRSPDVLEAGPRPGRAPGAVDVVLVVVDTERADYTSTYGYGLETTPFLTAASRRGVTFTRAFAPGPWTVPSMFSLVTGLYPIEHGITTGWVRGLDMGGQKVLPGVAETLTERLRDAGYSTFGVCTNFHLSPRFGFTQGFDKVVGEDFASMPFPNIAVESLEERIARSPRYFLWLHYFDPHFPYLPRRPWFERWNTSQIAGYEELMFDATITYYDSERELPGTAPLTSRDAVWVEKLARLLLFRPVALVDYMEERGLEPEDRWVRFFEAAYASEIRLVDRAMEEALAGIGVDDGTLVIITSDHGEEIFDHGQLGHRNNNALWQELIHVPLVILLPGRAHAGVVVDAPVSLVDLLPTILDVVGVPVPGDLSGLSLVPLIEDGYLPERPLWSEVTCDGNVLRCLVRYPWKYVHDYKGGDGRLYNIEEDPSEKHDLSRSDPDRAMRMRVELLDHYEKEQPRWIVEQTPDLTQEEVMRLKLLGYIR